MFSPGQVVWQFEVLSGHESTSTHDLFWRRELLRWNTPLGSAKATYVFWFVGFLYCKIVSIPSPLRTEDGGEVI